MLLLSGLLRVIFIIGESSDTQAHIWNISLSKKFWRLMHNDVENSVVKGKRGYPVLHHHIISYFPQQYWILVGKALNFLYDILVIILFYFVVNIYFDWTMKSEFSLGFWAALLLGTSPILLPVTARVKSIGARVAGYMWVCFYLLALAFFLYDTTSFWYLSSLLVLLGVLIILTSQMAFQFLIFFNIIFSILFFNIFPFVILCAILLIAYIFPQLGLKNIIDFKIAHSKWYRKNQNGTTVDGRNTIAQFTDFFNDKGSFFKKLYRLSILLNSSS